MNAYSFTINIANYIAQTGDVKMGNLLLFRAKFLECYAYSERVLS